jgi:hypothetical protein
MDIHKIHLICYNKHTNMSQTKPHLPGHPTALEQNIAVAVVLWVMFAGVCVLIANAWAMEMIG